MRNEFLFISDCHLDNSRPDVTETLIEFLSTRATDARCLYILGDLFEAWLGDDDPAEENQSVIAVLKRLAAHTEVRFMAGNRDFLLGEQFSRSIPMQRLADPRKLQLGGQTIVLMHGDLLCTDDADYQAFRKQIRSDRWQIDFLAQSLQKRQQIAARLRNDSNLAMSQKAAEIMDVNEITVAETFSQHQAKAIIHGHTHRPAVHQYQAGLTRYVLGDWNPGPSYLSWKPQQGFQLTDPRVSTTHSGGGT